MNTHPPLLSKRVPLRKKDARAVDRDVALVGGAGFEAAAADGLIAKVVAAIGGSDTLRIGVAADSAFKSTAVAESTLEVLAQIVFASAPLAELAAATRTRSSEIVWR
jgi:hypothetical protein